MQPGSVPSVAEWALRERFATDESEIAWDMLGAGPPVVLVHGTPWSSLVWRRVAARLAERFAVYVFDLLGFGASEKRPGQDVSLTAHGGSRQEQRAEPRRPRAARRVVSTA